MLVFSFRYLGSCKMISTCAYFFSAYGRRHYVFFAYIIFIYMSKSFQEVLIQSFRTAALFSC